MTELHVFTGPMASGKTSKMLTKLHNYSNVRKEIVLLITPKKDTRGEGISTHTFGTEIKVPLGQYIEHVRVSNLKELSDCRVEKYNMIGIDEAEFFGDLYSFVQDIFMKSRKTIYISGLAYDSDNNQFGQVADLLPLATTFKKMPAICGSCEPHHETMAGFTSYNGEKDSVIVIGGLDVYTPKCAYHFFVDLIK